MQNSQVYLIIIMQLYFSSHEPFSHEPFHMSQRLIGELIVYSWSGVCRPSIPQSFTMLKHLLQNHWTNQRQILCGAFWVDGTKVCFQDMGHMTKIAATPIYGTNHSKSFPYPVG